MRPLAIATLFLVGCSSSDPLLVGHLDSPRHKGEYLTLKATVESLNADEAKRPLKRRVHILHSDSGTTLDQLHAQTVRLGSANKVAAIIGGHSSAEAVAIGRAANADSIPAFVLTGDPGSSPNPWMFCLGVSPRKQAERLIEVLKDKPKRLLVLVPAKSDGIESVREALQGVARSAEFELREVSVEDGASFTSAIRQNQPTAIAILDPNTTKAFALIEGEPPRSETAIFLLGDESIRPVGNVKLPIYRTLTFAPDSADAAVAAFGSQFRNHSPMDDPTSALLAKDALDIFVQACQRADSIQSTKIRDELLKKDAQFDVIDGKLSFSRDGTCSRSGTVVQWRDGGWKSK